MTIATEPDIHDMVTDLTRTTTHREPYSQRRGLEVWNSRHITTVPSLIHQLLGSTPASQATESGNPGYSSRPAGRLEAVDTIMLIDDEASRWVRQLGHDDPGDELEVISRSPGPIGPVCVRCNHRSCVAIRRGEHIERRAIPGSGTIACLRLLHGLHASAKPCARRRPPRDGTGWCCTAHHLEADVRRWWHQARIITGWDTAAWRPDNSCPLCEQRRSLRINLTMQAGFCVECRSVWGRDEIGLLAEHIRTENAEDTLDGRSA